jgi:hypothetical protein
MTEQDEQYRFAADPEADAVLKELGIVRRMVDASSQIPMTYYFSDKAAAAEQSRSRLMVDEEGGVEVDIAPPNPTVNRVMMPEEKQPVSMTYRYLPDPGVLRAAHVELALDPEERAGVESLINAVSRRG